jgi:DmsE family decaheme c-type cytochrome
MRVLVSGPWTAAAIVSVALVSAPGFVLAQDQPSPTPAAPTPAAAAKAEAPPLCIDCHEDQGKNFPRNPHIRPFSAAKPPTAATNAPCASCHGDGTKHMASSGEDKSDIRVLQGRKGADFCTTCHVESSSHASFKMGVHASTEAVNCLTCHSIHKADPKSLHLNVKTTQALCQTCHPTQAASMQNKPFTHRPVVGIMDCTSCHDPHGRPGRETLKWTRSGELPCLSCHSEKRGPFVFEHPKGLSAESASNCLSCHEPHGSSNPKQLVRARVDLLCLECHSRITANTLGGQPPSFHDLSLPRYRNCTTCHVAIHGSNLSPTLFK